MGNAIKNYERKRRREKRQAEREIMSAIHDSIVRDCDMPGVMRKVEKHVFEAAARRF